MWAGTCAHLLGPQVHAHVQLQVFRDGLVQQHPGALQRRQSVLGDGNLHAVGAGGTASDSTGKQAEARHFWEGTQAGCHSSLYPCGSMEQQGQGRLLGLTLLNSTLLPASSAAERGAKEGLSGRGASSTSTSMPCAAGAAS